MHTSVLQNHYKCTMDGPRLSDGCTTNASWMYLGCTMKAPRMYFGRTRDALWMYYGDTRFTYMCYGCTRSATQMHIRCTLNTYMCTRNASHITMCFTDAPRMLFRCYTDVQWRCTEAFLMNKRRHEGFLIDVSLTPHRYGITTDVPWIQYACIAYAAAGSLSLDNLVYLCFSS